ncbi:SDR family oxidoreductase [Sorangium sp. So ce375]|uniref:SDR family oxidoreductase n=1 Tax=Sorangium sp. So ce375 TaxID=3133306 RepID=UPI003F5BBA20
MTRELRSLITGSSSGFGRAIALTLARAGHRVFAGMRGINSKNQGPASELAELGAREGLALRAIELDVTSDASVDAAVARVLDEAGGVDVVVNNAGVYAQGPTEAFTVTQAEAAFQVNYFGAVRVNRAVLPAMRRQKSGLLVHVSSTLGRVVMPLCGHYCASKFALEAMAEGCRYELAPLGIDVAIVEPGLFPTTSVMANATQAADAARAAEYGPLFALTAEMGKPMMEMVNRNGPPDPQQIADAIRKLAELPAGERPLRTELDPLGNGAAEEINRRTGELQRGYVEWLGIGGLLRRTGG